MANDLIQIRCARIEDIPTIRDITKLLTVSRNDKTPTGFVEFPLPSSEDYSRRISENPYFLVAEIQMSIAGFSSQFTDDFLRGQFSLYQQEEIRTDPILNYILSRESPILYGEQLAVIKPHQGKGIGRSLMSHGISKAKDQGITSLWAAAAHTPLRNEISIHLLTSLGYSCKEEIQADGLAFGMYHLHNVMKTLKFGDHLVEPILSRCKTVTWRLFDNKNLTKGDLISLCRNNGTEIAEARILSVDETTFGALTPEEVTKRGFSSEIQMYNHYTSLYRRHVDRSTSLKIVYFDLMN